MTASFGVRRKRSLDMRKQPESNGRATPRWGEMGGPNREATQRLASWIPQVLLALGDRSVHRGMPSTERTWSWRQRWRVPSPRGRWGCGERTDLYLEDPVGVGGQRHLPGD